MQKEIKINITQEMSNLVQRAYYELDARDRIISILASKKNVDINSTVFKFYQDEQLKASNQYKLILEYMIRMYVPISFHGKYDWSLDYENCILTVTVFNEEDIKTIEGMILNDKEESL